MANKLPIETFEQWLQTVKGQAVHKSIIAYSAEKNQVYIKNCLWWAFNAGQEAVVEDNKKQDEFRKMLNRVLANQHRLPELLVKDIKNILKK